MTDKDKIHQRVLEIQQNLEKSTPEQQVNMLGELFSIVSQIEQSLSEVKEDISNLENQLDKNEE